MRFRNAPGEIYRTSGTLTSSRRLSELMGLINAFTALHLHILLHYFNKTIILSLQFFFFFFFSKKEFSRETLL